MMMSEQKTYLGFKGNLWALLVVNALIVVALIWHFKSYETEKKQEEVLHKKVAQKIDQESNPIPNKKEASKKVEVIKSNPKKQLENSSVQATKVLKTYLVEEGDSYASLAAKLDISSQDLYQLNHGMPLDAGILIMLPETPSLNLNKEEATTIEKPKVEEVVAAKKAVKTEVAQEIKKITQAKESIDKPVAYYTVVKGDTLYSISKKYKMSVEQIIQLNGLNQSQVNLGQKLVVSQSLTTASDQPLKPEPLTVEVGTPFAQTQEQWHTVTKGETLWGISQKYKISVDELKKLNNISNNQVNIGQKLQVK